MRFTHAHHPVLNTGLYVVVSYKASVTMVKVRVWLCERKARREELEEAGEEERRGGGGKSCMH